MRCTALCRDVVRFAGEAMMPDQAHAPNRTWSAVYCGLRANGWSTARPLVLM